jgi:hypothetical protein
MPPGAAFLVLVHPSGSIRMLDLAYLLLTVGFFALMLGYVRACAAVGRRSAPSDARPVPPQRSDT